jgi:hypothetical protein
MPEPLPPITVARRTGDEPFHTGSKNLPVNLLAFWQWSTSDLVSNVTRGRLAEFIVATALGIDVSGVRNEWDAFDLINSSGLKIEVKSAARVQSWYQSRLSDIVWRTPRTRAWDAATNHWSDESRRQADVYVLAFLHHENKSEIDPLNVDQWHFFVLPTCDLDSRTRSQHSITLRSVEAMVEGFVDYRGLAAAVAKAGDRQRAVVQPK